MLERVSAPFAADYARSDVMETDESGGQPRRGGYVVELSPFSTASVSSVPAERSMK